MEYIDLASEIDCYYTIIVVCCLPVYSYTCSRKVYNLNQMLWQVIVGIVISALHIYIRSCRSLTVLIYE